MNNTISCSKDIQSFQEIAPWVHACCSSDLTANENKRGQFLNHLTVFMGDMGPEWVISYWVD